MEKLDCILLIDDDEPTNFINRMAIEELGCAKKIVEVLSAKAALDYLTSKHLDEYPQPDLIFLDINMPGMSGWEFLEEYNQLDEEQKGKIVVMMLTTSLNPDDREKATNLPNITGFMSKPLTKEMLQEVLEKHFG